MIGTAWTSHRAFSGDDCDGTLTVTDKLSDRVWIASCDRCPCDVGVHESRLSGPREVAPQDRTITPKTAADVAESW